jgi:mannose-6-phosphate isomerase-like protein (cupin superfamily)
MQHHEILDSGLLELFAIGTLEGRELSMVTDALASDPALRTELSHIEDALMLLAEAHAVAPNPTVKLLLMAKINYAGRLEQGEVPAKVPTLHPDSKLIDFKPWLDRPDLQAPADYNEGYVSIVSQERDKTTALVWLRYGAPPETHTIDHEKFLIAEGTCDITIGTTVHSLKAGDYLSIPLHVSHHVMVTSKIPCKIILQRVAA